MGNKRKNGGTARKEGVGGNNVIYMCMCVCVYIYLKCIYIFFLFNQNLYYNKNIIQVNSPRNHDWLNKLDKQITHYKLT